MFGWLFGGIAPAGAAAAPGRPTPTAPNGSISTTKPTFTWSKAFRATSYELRVYKGGRPVVSQTGIITQSWKCGRTLPKNVGLTWKVRARNAAGSGAWSNSLKLRIHFLYKPYFGDLHAHTSVSDGTGTPVGAYASAQAAGMDFFAVTDHRVRVGPQAWRATQAAADAATSQTFVGVAAYELGWEFHHHVNTFAVESIITQSETSQADSPAVDFIDPLLASPGAIGQFNHPTWNGGKDFDDFAGVTPERDAVMNLLEIYNGLADDSRSSSSYVKCLDAGWHVMPVAVSDAHYVDWDTTKVPYDFRTVLLAPKLTRTGLFAAMRAYRGYATMDEDLRVDVKVDGAVMGSVVTPAIRYAVSVAVTDPDTLAPDDGLTKLELVGNGGAVAASRGVSGHSVTWTPTVNSSTARYFWLRVTTGDGVTAWTAPVWTGR